MTQLARICVLYEDFMFEVNQILGGLQGQTSGDANIHRNFYFARRAMATTWEMKQAGRCARLEPGVQGAKGEAGAPASDDLGRRRVAHPDSERIPAHRVFAVQKFRNGSRPKPYNSRDFRQSNVALAPGTRLGAYELLTLIGGRRTGAVRLCIALVAGAVAIDAASFRVRTLLGTGVPGSSPTQVNNPYGLVIGPDGGLFFCDLDNQRIRRFDLTTRTTTVVAGNGERGHSGDGGLATDASLNMPHEIRFDRKGDLFIAERDSHVVRKVDMKTHAISTVAGIGTAGFGGDGGPANRAELRQPHSIAFDRDGTLLICDIGNHRIRRVNLRTGIISTYAGTGETAATPDGSPVAGTPLRGPRTIEVAPNADLYVALREGNAIYRIDAATQTLHHIAGTGEQGYSGDGGPATAAKLGGPKGLSLGRDGFLYVADTENHVVRRVDIRSGVIETVLGTGVRGNTDGDDPLRVRLSRPHGVFVTNRKVFVSDSESHRIRVLE